MQRVADSNWIAVSISSPRGDKKASGVYDPARYYYKHKKRSIADESFTFLTLRTRIKIRMLLASLFLCFLNFQSSKEAGGHHDCYRKAMISSEAGRFNPLKRRGAIHTLIFLSPRIATKRIVSLFFARLYQPCEPQGQQAKNHAKLGDVCWMRTHPIACKVFQSRSIALDCNLRTVIACMRFSSQPEFFTHLFIPCKMPTRCKVCCMSSIRCTPS